MTQTTTVKPIKVYVAVKTDFAADGTMLPRRLPGKMVSVLR